MIPTALVTDELCFWHDPGNYALVLKPGGYVEPYNRHIENPDPKRRMLNLITVSGLRDRLIALSGRDATDDELLRVHTAAHLDHVRAVAAQGGGELGIGAAIAANGYAVAKRSAGCALAAVDAVIAGQARHAYALTRPPGHHAEPERSMGFCVFSNAALAAEHAIAHHGLSRVAVVDWDVHYGNGTDACFAQRADVLAISIHQDAGYLQVGGSMEEIGQGAGRGYSLNVPLPPGCGDGAYREAFEKVILPALEAFKPELIVVACGYDAGRMDPLGRMLLDGVTFRWMTEAMVDMAARHAQGRLVFTHEGGYCPASVPFFGLAVLEALSQQETDVVCPFSAQHHKVAGQALIDYQRDQIALMARHAEDMRQRHWR